MTLHQPPAAVVDSFLLQDGRMTGLARHRERFTAAVREVVGDAAAEDVPALVARFTQEVPLEGRWFPRWECTAAGRLRWRLREAPEPTLCIRVPQDPVPDERTTVTHKGPDLDWLHGVLQGAPAGCTDVVLAGPEGVRETATCAIVVWTDQGAVTPDVAMTSTTLQWLEHVLSETGRTITRRPVPVAEFLEAASDGGVWALNALHGPRCLVVPTLEHPDTCSHLDSWRARWFADAEPLP